MTTHRPKTDEPRVNTQITAQSVRLIDAQGQMVGVVSLSEGLKMAEAAGLDLVEVSPTASPPVCKIIDYGKYKYELQKKANEARKKQKVISVKEIKLRPTIDKHDLSIKMRNARKFLEDGDKVKVSLRFRGREMSHREIAFELMQNVQVELDEISKVEMSPRVEGRQMLMMLVPK